MADTFDDRKLQNIARYNFYSSKSDDKAVEKLLSKDKLTNDERNTLLEFIEANRYTKPLSIKDMKEEIFALIGRPPVGNSYSTTVSRGELEHIYKHIMGSKNGRR